MNDVMLDLESLGTRPGSVIVSIGAVFFGPEGLGAELYLVIDVGSCVDAGLTIDPATVCWWMQQSEDARAVFNARERRHLGEVLIEFQAFIMAHTHTDEVRVWGNGAAFDNVLLAAAYHARSMLAPWRYRNDRCYRTVAAEHPTIEMVERAGTLHHALDDAKAQALHLIEIKNCLRAWEDGR